MSTIDKDGWLHTGDVAWFDQDGYLHISDRLKDIIKYKGYQVSNLKSQGIGIFARPSTHYADLVTVSHDVDLIAQTSPTEDMFFAF